ncbi:MAG: hypothetical protein HYR55_06990 [Acidobacteria bacterium]|nr:hypothetical protein [Acidobacteriota bacterium]MBI3656224.1 hypothetical protein [Acidobacteriota bacterium]
MSCEVNRENLTAHMAGELAMGESEALRLHMAVCVACTQYLAELERLETFCGIWEEVEPSPKFDARFWAAVDGAANKPELRIMDWLCSRLSFSINWRMARVAIMLSLCFGLSLLVMKQPVPSGTGSSVAEESPATFAEFLRIQEEEDQIKDFDVIANLELLEHFDEVKNQWLRLPVAQQGTN